MYIGFKLVFPVGWIKNWFGVFEWCEGQMRERLARGRDPESKRGEYRDLAHYLMEQEY